MPTPSAYPTGRRDYNCLLEAMFFCNLDNLANGQYVGFAEVCEVAADGAVGDLVYLGASGYDKAKADVDATCMARGMRLETGIGKRLILKWGWYRDDTLFSARSRGDRIFVSPTTAGAFVAAQPAVAGNRVNEPGMMVRATIIHLAPETMFFEVPA